MANLGRNSEQLPSRKYVVPGKPEESYLMNKIDGSNDCSGFMCVGAAGCGVQMPQLSPPLEPGRMNMVRDWIKQGAN
jgi:hypothetical protein